MSNDRRERGHQCLSPPWESQRAMGRMASSMEGRDNDGILCKTGSFYLVWWEDSLKGFAQPRDRVKTV